MRPHVFSGPLHIGYPVKMDMLTNQLTDMMMDKSRGLSNEDEIVATMSVGLHRRNSLIKHLTTLGISRI